MQAMTIRSFYSPWQVARVLYEATRAWIGEDHIRIADQLHDVAQDDHGVTATFIRRDGSDETVTARGDVLIAADGHSFHRASYILFPAKERPPGTASCSGVAPLSTHRF